MKNDEPLSTEEIEAFTATNSDWSFEDDRLKAKFVLADFDAAIRVLNAVADTAREMDHHPLMTNVYDRLMFSLSTHRAGDKVTELDVELAKKISSLIAEETDKE